MLLNSAPSQAVPTRNDMTADVTLDVGRALLATLEQLAQRELAAMAATTAAADPCPDPAFAALAWDLGLSGDEIESTPSPLGT